MIPGKPAVDYTAVKALKGSPDWQTVSVSLNELVATDPKVTAPLANWQSVTEFSLSPSGTTVRAGQKVKADGQPWRGPREIRNLHWEGGSYSRQQTADAALRRRSSKEFQRRDSQIVGAGETQPQAHSLSMNPTLALLTALLLAPLGTLPAADAAPARPNILFIFADDQRADTIAALGNPAIKTPHLDRLVRSGVAFNRAYMQGGLNGATCVPSRAMLLSGRNLFHIDEKLMRDSTWPEAFGQAGYTTFVSGKWHNGDASLARSFQHARSMFTGGMTNPMQAKLRNVVDGKVGEAKPTPHHACQVFADETIRFLQEHKDGPFFAYLPFDGPTTRTSSRTSFRFITPPTRFRSRPTSCPSTRGTTAR